MAQTVSSVVDSGSAPSRRHQPRRALEADDAVQRRRDADRAAGVGAQADEGRAGGHRDRRARGRAAGNARRGRHRAGLAGVPWCGLTPTPEKANSVMLVRPIRRRRRRAAAPPRGRRRAPAAHAASTREPAGVGWPATSNRSLTEKARPASGCRGAAARGRRAASSNSGAGEGVRAGRRLGRGDGALDLGARVGSRLPAGRARVAWRSGCMGWSGAAG